MRASSDTALADHTSTAVTSGSATDRVVPLCVDLDGTLVTSDTVLESMLTLVRQDPWALLYLPIWMLGGRASFKQRVAERVTPAASRLPYRPELIEYLERHKRAGRTLILVTAAHESTARSVAAYLGLFDRVMASDAQRNLKGGRKAAALVAEFGERGFDYAGDSRADLAVWSLARRALVVGSSAFAQRVGTLAQVEKVFERPAVSLTDWANALRVYQWVKNLLLFVPLIAAHKANDIGLVLHGLVAFLAFSLCASSVYVINDLFDLDADRAHPWKSSRPFASGRLSIASGIAAAPILLAIAFAIATRLPLGFMAILALYFAVALLYSLRLKRRAVLDVLVLAGLYTLRLLAGAAAVSVLASFWLLAFSMFLFLSLALVKRVGELGNLPADASAAGRGYRRDDLPVLMALGTASGYTAVMVFALYINSSTSELLYRHPRALWLLCPLLLFWVSRVWLFTHRGEMHDDPIVFAFRDPVSLWLVVPAAAILWLAI